MAAAPPADLRRTNRSIPLLPSGSGGVFDLSSSGGEKRRLRDAGGIACRFERAAMDGRTGAQHHGWLLARNGGGPVSGSPAHESIDTVASFRIWRGFRSIVAEAPTGPP